MIDFNQLVAEKATPSTGRARFTEPVITTPEADAKRHSYQLNDKAVKLLNGEAGDGIFLASHLDPEGVERIYVINLKDNSAVKTASLKKNNKFTCKDFAEVTANLEPDTTYVLKEVKNARNFPDGSSVAFIDGIYGAEETTSEVQVEEESQTTPDYEEELQVPASDDLPFGDTSNQEEETNSVNQNW